MSTAPHTSPRSAAAPRSLAEELRGRADAELARLLRERPDLTVPVPADLSALAARAAGRVSVQRVVDGLDTASLQVLEVLVVLPEPTTATAVSRRWGADADPVLARLRRLGLLWGSERRLYLVRAARDLFEPHPAGLGPPLAEALGRRSPSRLTELLEDLGRPPTADPDTALVRLAEHLGDEQVLQELLGHAPEGARQVLDHLTWGPPSGRLPDADRPVRSATASGPVEWLLARGLLAVADPGHVVLPREIGLALRGGRVHHAQAPSPEPLAGTVCPAARADTAALAAIAEIVQHVAGLGEAWGWTPPAVLRSGGLGVRDLRRTATLLGVDEETAAFVVELAWLSGLIADDGEADPRWAPTPAFDDWRERSTAERWLLLAVRWLTTTRVPGLAGIREEGVPARTVLGPDLDRTDAAAVRGWALRRLAEAAEGARAVPCSVPAAGTRKAGRAGRARSADGAGRFAVDAESLRRRLDWDGPRRAGTMRHRLLTWVLREAAWLGITGAGALSRYGRALLESIEPVLDRTGDPDDPDEELWPPVRELPSPVGTDGAAGVVRILDGDLPSPIDHVLLQADLTAVAPGPLQQWLARQLALVADVDSRGGATVYRFTPESVRRALDHGANADDLLRLLAGHSPTPVPQPLEYLIRDVARRHGKIRVSPVTTVLRADDEAALSELLADRRAAGLGLRRLAPTVLAASVPPESVLATLRSMGLAPAAETADGDLFVRHDAVRRTPPRAAPAPVRALPAGPTGPVLTALVGALRAVDRAEGGTGGEDGTAPRDAATAPGSLVPMDPVRVLDAVREAVRTRTTVWLGYVEPRGQIRQVLVSPVRVQDGRITAVDRGDDTLQTYSVHRVTAVAPVAPVAPVEDTAR